MVEAKIDYSIGHLRMKYLDLANIKFAQGDFISCKGFINNFLDTVKDESPAGISIKIEFDKINNMIKQQIRDMEIGMGNLGWLEKRDYETKGREEIEINKIHDMKEICWRIGLKEGLFYD